MKKISFFISAFLTMSFLSYSFISIAKDPVLKKSSPSVVDQKKMTDIFLSPEIIGLKNKGDKEGIMKILKKNSVVLSPQSLPIMSKCTAPYEKVEYTPTGILDAEVEYGCQLPDDEWNRLSCPTGYEWGPDFQRPSQYYCKSNGDSSYSITAAVNFYLAATCASGYSFGDIWAANYGGYLYVSFECTMDSGDIDYDEICGSSFFGMTSNSGTEASDGRQIYLCEPE